MVVQHDAVVPVHAELAHSRHHASWYAPQPDLVVIHLHIQTDTMLLAQLWA